MLKIITSTSIVIILKILKQYKTDSHFQYDLHIHLHYQILEYTVNHYEPKITN